MDRREFLAASASLAGAALLGKVAEAKEEPKLSDAELVWTQVRGPGVGVDWIVTHRRRFKIKNIRTRRGELVESPALHSRKARHYGSVLFGADLEDVKKFHCERLALGALHFDFMTVDMWEGTLIFNHPRFNLGELFNPKVPPEEEQAVSQGGIYLVHMMPWLHSKDGKMLPWFEEDRS
jgi:hypothetical protein